MQTPSAQPGDGAPQQNASDINGLVLSLFESEGEAVEPLLDEDCLFQTIDDDHFKATDGPRLYKCWQMAANLEDCVHNGVYPAEEVEGLYGVSANTTIGIVVYNCWNSLFVHNAADTEGVAEAMAKGRLPAYFEDCIGMLVTEGEHPDLPPHTGYTLRMNGVDPGSIWYMEKISTRLDELPKGPLFSSIAWDARGLGALSGDTYV